MRSLGELRRTVLFLALTLGASPALAQQGGSTGMVGTPGYMAGWDASGKPSNVLPGFTDVTRVCALINGLNECVSPTFQMTTGALWTTANNTIALSAACPPYFSPGANIALNTTGASIGTALSCSGYTLTLTSTANIGGPLAATINFQFDNAPLIPSLLSAISASSSGGGELRFPKIPGAVSANYYFTKTFEWTRDGKVFCEGGGGGGLSPSVRLVFPPGVTGLRAQNSFESVYDNGGAKVLFEGCGVYAIGSMAQTAPWSTTVNQVTPNSNVISSAAVPSTYGVLLGIPTDAWAAGDGIVVATSWKTSNEDFGPISPPGAFVTGPVVGGALTIDPAFPIYVPSRLGLLSDSDPTGDGTSWTFPTTSTMKQVWGPTCCGATPYIYNGDLVYLGTPTWNGSAYVGTLVGTVNGVSGGVITCSVTNGGNCAPTPRKWTGPGYVVANVFHQTGAGTGAIAVGDALTWTDAATIRGYYIAQTGAPTVAGDIAAFFLNDAPLTTLSATPGTTFTTTQPYAIVGKRTTATWRLSAALAHTLVVSNGASSAVETLPTTCTSNVNFTLNSFTMTVTSACTGTGLALGDVLTATQLKPATTILTGPTVCGPNTCYTLSQAATATATGQSLGSSPLPPLVDGDMIWMQGFPFGTLVGTVVSTGATRTINFRNAAFTAAASSTVVGSDVMVKAWTLSAGIEFIVQSVARDNLAWGFPIGISLPCSVGYGSHNCTLSELSHNQTWESLIGRYTAGDNTGGSTFVGNFNVYSFFADVVDMATVGSVSVGEMSECREDNSTCSVARLVNCSNQNYTTYVGEYIAGEQQQCMNDSVPASSMLTLPPRVDSSRRGMLHIGPLQSWALDGYGILPGRFMGPWTFSLGGFDPCTEVSSQGQMFYAQIMFMPKCNDATGALGVAYSPSLGIEALFAASTPATWWLGFPAYLWTGRTDIGDFAANGVGGRGLPVFRVGLTIGTPGSETAMQRASTIPVAANPNQNRGDIWWNYGTGLFGGWFNDTTGLSPHPFGAFISKVTPPVTGNLNAQLADGVGDSGLSATAAVALDIRTGTDTTKPVTSAALAGSAAWQPLTFVGGGTTLWSVASGYNAKVTLTASTTTLGNPSGLFDGETIQIKLYQGGSGSYTVAYGSMYDFGAAGAPTLTTTVGLADLITCTYDAAPATLKLGCSVTKGVH